MAYDTTPFSVAHYILLMCMIVACGGIVVYATMHDMGATNDVLSVPVRPASSEQTECAQTVTDAISQIWAYSPDTIPQKYKEIAISYYTGILDAPVSGECNGRRYTCRRGMRRSDCDPCAADSARVYAISIHTQDMIKKHCDE